MDKAGHGASMFQPPWRGRADGSSAFRLEVAQITSVHILHMVKHSCKLEVELQNQSLAGPPHVTCVLAYHPLCITGKENGFKGQLAVFATCRHWKKCLTLENRKSQKKFPRKKNTLLSWDLRRWVGVCQMENTGQSIPCGRNGIDRRGKCMENLGLIPRSNFSSLPRRIVSGKYTDFPPHPVAPDFHAETK